MITVEYGPDSYPIREIRGESVVGLLVEDFVSDEVIAGLFNLTGEEAFEVSSNGAGFRTVADNYRLRDGDVVRFGRTGGEKAR